MKNLFALLFGTVLILAVPMGLYAQTCDYIPGDVNGNGSVNGIDITYVISYFKGHQVPPIDCNPPCTGVSDPFYAAGDVNGDCRFNGLDILFWISHPGSLRWCPSCPPTDLVRGLPSQAD
jgi:hypothetical protein